MLKIAICDDTISELKILYNAVTEFVKIYIEYNFNVKMFSSAYELLEDVEKSGGFDILILDVIMPDINGIELAQKIRQRNEKCEIIYISGSKEFAIDAFEVGALHYLIKPFKKEKLNNVLTKAIKIIKTTVPKYIIKKTNKGIRKINLLDIVYIESMEHYQHIHLNNSEILIIYDKLSNIYSELAEDNRFFMPHRSFIVNMNYISSIMQKDIVMTSGIKIPLPKNKYLKVKDMYTSYMIQPKVK